MQGSLERDQASERLPLKDPNDTRIRIFVIVVVSFVFFPVCPLCHLSVFCLLPLVFCLGRGLGLSSNVLVFRPLSFVFRPLSFVFRPLSFVLCLSSFVFRPLSFVLCLSSFVFRLSSFVLRFSSFIFVFVFVVVFCISIRICIVSSWSWSWSESVYLTSSNLLLSLVFCLRDLYSILSYVLSFVFSSKP